MKFSIKDFFSKISFNEEIRNGKPHFRSLYMMPNILIYECVRVTVLFRGNKVKRRYYLIIDTVV